ncbi:MAG: hypothetical protein OXT67_10135 [Zetaproteobacteria bacterium]|nr:hypothetical protein [Zetaproteobacteria bacterium]
MLLLPPLVQHMYICARRRLAREPVRIREVIEQIEQQLQQRLTQPQEQGTVQLVRALLGVNRLRLPGADVENGDGGRTVTRRRYVWFYPEAQPTLPGRVVNWVQKDYIYGIALEVEHPQSAGTLYVLPLTEVSLRDRRLRLRQADLGLSKPAKEDFLDPSPIPSGVQRRRVENREANFAAFEQMMAKAGLTRQDVNLRQDQRLAVYHVEGVDKVVTLKTSQENSPALTLIWAPQN